MHTYVCVLAYWDNMGYPIPGTYRILVFKNYNLVYCMCVIEVSSVGGNVFVQ